GPDGQGPRPERQQRVAAFAIESAPDPPARARPREEHRVRRKPQATFEDVEEQEDPEQLHRDGSGRALLAPAPEQAPDAGAERDSAGDEYLPELPEQARLDQRRPRAAEDQSLEPDLRDAVALDELGVGVAGLERVGAEQLVGRVRRGRELLGARDERRGHHAAAAEQLDELVDRLVPFALAEDRPRQVVWRRVVGRPFLPPQPLPPR